MPDKPRQITPMHSPRDESPWQRTRKVQRVTGRALQRRNARIKLRDVYQCQNKQCGIVLTDGQVDHKVALAFGGSDDDDNLQYLCKRCNQAKGLAESRGVQLVNPSDFNPENARRVKTTEGDSFFNIGEAFSLEYGRGRVKA